MALNLISDEQVVINNDNRYVKMSVRRDLEEIYTEIMNDDYFIKYFYGEMKKNTTLIYDLFAHIDDMTPGERLIRLASLPPIPEFLCDSKHIIYLKLNEEQFNLINKLARTLDTQMSNLTRILFFISMPRKLYQEFPYLLDHYRFTEEILNFYLQKTDSEERLQYYDTIKEYI